MKAWRVYIKEQDSDVWSSCVFAKDKQQAISAWLDNCGLQWLFDINDITAIREPKFDGLCDKITVIDSPRELNGMGSFWGACPKP